MYRIVVWPTSTQIYIREQHVSAHTIYINRLIDMNKICYPFLVNRLINLHANFHDPKILSR